MEPLPVTQPETNVDKSTNTNEPLAQSPPPEPSPVSEQKNKKGLIAAILVGIIILIGLGFVVFSVTGSNGSAERPRLSTESIDKGKCPEISMKLYDPTTNYYISECRQSPVSIDGETSGAYFVRITLSDDEKNKRDLDCATSSKDCTVKKFVNAVISNDTIRLNDNSPKAVLTNSPPDNIPDVSLMGCPVIQLPSEQGKKNELISSKKVSTTILNIDKADPSWVTTLGATVTSKQSGISCSFESKSTQELFGETEPMVAFTAFSISGIAACSKSASKLPDYLRCKAEQIMQSGKIEDCEQLRTIEKEDYLWNSEFREGTSECVLHFAWKSRDVNLCTKPVLSETCKMYYESLEKSAQRYQLRI